MAVLSTPPAMENLELWSAYYLDRPEQVEDGTCAVVEPVWLRIHDEMPEAKRIFARVRLGDKELITPLGAPLPGTGGVQRRRLYVSPGLDARLGVTGEGEDITVEWLTEEAFPEATRLVLRPHDSAFFHADAREELEVFLTKRGVLRQGEMIQVPIEALGGFEVGFDVVITEPANLVLMQGDEVALEFEEAVDAAADRAVREAAATREAELAAARNAEEFASTATMVPVAAPAEPQGQRLGGVARPRMADGRAWNPWRDG